MNKRMMLWVGLALCGSCGQSEAPSGARPAQTTPAPVGAGPSQAAAAIDGADVIYRNARIYTVDSTRPQAAAMAVRDGRIVAIGSEADVAGQRGAATEVVDLAGRTVMPGIHDTHIHPSDAGVGKTIECSFAAQALSEALSALQACLKDLPPGAWLRGGQWNDGLFAETDALPRTILDEIAPDNPVFLMDWSVHNAWVNSRALEIFGVDADTPDPAGGVIVRDPGTGEATGILLDNAAYENRRRLPRYSLAQRTEALAWAIDRIAAYGITTFKEAIVTTPTLEAYGRLEARGQLPLNVKTSLTWKSAWAESHAAETALLEARADFATDRIDTGFAKIMLDGIPPTYTAAMLEPYVPSEAFGADWRGKMMFAPDMLREDVVELDARGLSVKIHATGDRAVRTALNAFEAARRRNGPDGPIHEVSHAELIHPDDIPRFAALNVAAEMCPILWYPIPGLDWAGLVGPDRTIWPIKDLLAAGALVIYGSDWPVIPTPNPWPGIEAMVTRADPDGRSAATLSPGQAIDLEAAVRIFTLNGAIANGVGATSGSLTVGKDADFIVLDRDIFAVPVTDVGETRVLMSVVGGREVLNEL